MYIFMIDEIDDIDDIDDKSSIHDDVSDKPLSLLTIFIDDFPMIFPFKVSCSAGTSQLAIQVNLALLEMPVTWMCGCVAVVFPL